MARILVGLSGGVDSSVAAALLVEQGHDVVGAYMKNWVNDEGIPGECPWEQDIQDALAVAKTTGIEFRVIDLVDEYRARIVNYLIEGYRAGYTPNPDVLCNREMKFGVFLDYALEQGFDYVATGHYARRMDTPQGAFILRGRDNVLNVFVTAPVVDCVRRVMETDGLNLEEAEKRIKKIDKRRADYFKYFTGRQWQDAALYDLCLNTGHMREQKCVDIVRAYMDARFE